MATKVTRVEADNPRGLAAEEILRKGMGDPIAAPLIEAFRAGVYPDSIITDPENKHTVKGDSTDPDALMEVSLCCARQLSRISFVYLDPNSSSPHRKPETVFTVNVLELWDGEGPPHPVAVRIVHNQIGYLDLSYPAAKSMLKMLGDISTRYLAINKDREKVRAQLYQGKVVP